MIEFYVSDKHEVKCNACFIGRTGENEAEEIRVIVPDCVCDKWLFLDFEKPDGTKFKTPKIDIVDGVGSYMLGGSLVDTAGMLKIEAVLQDENGVCWKSEKKEYYVSKSIDATEEIARDNPDFISQAQATLDNAVTDVQVDGNSVVENRVAKINLKDMVIQILIDYGLLKSGDLTPEQIKALSEMECLINENGELVISFDNQVLNLNFNIEGKDLIVEKEMNADFSINANGEMEVSY